MPSYPTYGDGRAYPDIGARFRRGAGRSYAAVGDYDSAIAIDDERAPTYAALQDRGERRQRDQESRTTEREIVDAASRNDFGAARSASR